MAHPFPLLAVLRLRKHKETTEERVLASVTAEVQAAKVSLSQLEQELRRQAVQSVGEVGERVLAIHLQSRSAHLESLQKRRLEQMAQVHALEVRQKEQQSQLLLARRDREMLTELEDAFVQARRAEEEQCERKRLDELSSFRKRRR